MTDRIYECITVEYFDDWFLSLNGSEQQDVLAAISEREFLDYLQGLE